MIKVNVPAKSIERLVKAVVRGKSAVVVPPAVLLRSSIVGKEIQQLGPVNASARAHVFQPLYFPITIKYPKSNKKKQDKQRSPLDPPQFLARSP